MEQIQHQLQWKPSGTCIDILNANKIPNNYSEQKILTIEFPDEVVIANEENSTSYTLGDMQFVHYRDVGTFIAFLLKTERGIGVGDLVCTKNSPRMPCTVTSIYPASPKSGFPYPWVHICGPIGSYGVYDKDLEPFKIENLPEGSLEILLSLNR